MTSVVEDRSVAPDPRPAPVPRPSHRPGRHLRPVSRPGRRRSPAVPVLVGAGIVIAALFTLAAMHALLIGGQLELDAMQREVASESEEIRRLRLRVAELESPDRVLDVARDRLGMVQPTEVGYLAPAGVDTGDDDRTRVAPAEVPPPPETEPPTGESTSDGSPVSTHQTEDAGAPEVESAPAAPVAGGGDE